MQNLKVLIWGAVILLALVSLGLWLGSCGRGVPENSSISGKVTFDGPGSPGVEGITVILSSTNQVAATNASGVYTFTNFAAGSHTITPTRDGWVFSPSSYTVTGAAENKNFVASLEGWANISDSSITDDLYDYKSYAYRSEIPGVQSYYVLAGANGKAYISTTSEPGSWSQLTSSDVTNAGDLIRSTAFTSNGIYYAEVYSRGKCMIWYQDDLPGGNDVPNVRDFSSFTDQAEDICVVHIDDTLNIAMLVKGGGLYYNSGDFFTNPPSFETTSRAPADITVRSVSGTYLSLTSKYAFLIGGDGGKLYWYVGTSIPTSSDWVALNSGTTEKITGISLTMSSDGSAVSALLVTEDGSFVAGASSALNNNANDWPSLKVVFSGLPYALYGVRGGAGKSGVVIVGSDGLILRSD